MEPDIKQFEDIENHLIAVPFHGKMVLVKGREISPLQIRAIGKFSLIQKKDSTPVSDWRELVNVFELQHRLVKAWLVSPTYDEILEVAKIDALEKDTDKRIKELSAEILKMPNGPEKAQYEQEIASIRLLHDLILPNDFTKAITEYALKKNETDINLITDEILLEAATLRQIQGGRVSDYISGTLTDFNKVDIDERGLILYAETMKGKQ